MYHPRLEVAVPATALAALRAVSPPTTGTLLAHDVAVSDKERDVLTALCSGYLRPFPHRDPRPATYQQIAVRLGEPWTRVTTRKQIERFRERLARGGLYFDGPHANNELDDYLLANRVIGAEDLARLAGTTTTR